MSQQTLPCNPTPNCRGCVHIFRIGVQCPQQNVLKEKPVLFGVIQVKRPKNLVFVHNDNDNDNDNEISLFRHK